MTHPLNVTHSTPLEREYEAWIIHGIEQYYQSIGKRISVWAVSPMDEVNWPADETLIIGKKLIGLQMKKVTYKCDGSTPRKFGRLNWTFHSPSRQYDLVLKFPEIFYCLPTFINRTLKDQALSHCLFWRPDETKRDKNAWYDNPGAPTPYNSIGTADRWGKFIESVTECTVGKKIQNISDAKSYIDNLTCYMREIENLPPKNTEIENEFDMLEKSKDTYVYLFAIPINS